MNRIVFDIECMGLDFENLDEITQHSFLNNCKDDEEREEAKKRTSLWPVTGEIVAIGMLNIDTDNAKVYFRGNEGENDEYEVDGVIYKIGSEKDILEWFWKDIQYFEQVITFNGRGFDAPYILFRSMVHGIKPTINLMPNRYGDYRTGFNSHLDLLDQLSHFGATRKFSLHMYSQALGIVSPKEGGVSGLDVPRLFNEGEYELIAKYCMRDVYATAELFRRWEVANLD